MPNLKQARKKKPSKTARMCNCGLPISRGIHKSWAGFMREVNKSECLGKIFKFYNHCLPQKLKNYKKAYVPESERCPYQEPHRAGENTATGKPDGAGRGKISKPHGGLIEYGP